jgi:zinc protease
MIRLIFCLPFLLIVTNSFVHSAEYMDNVTEQRLDNGMDIILAENHKAQVISFQVWYRAGSRNDVWGKTGLAHVFEHLMFKGTKNISKEEFARQIQEVGGNFNAFTSHDFAAYFENTAADHIEIPIRLEADRMQNLEFTKEEFQTEKMVVIEERRLRTQDRPKAFLTEQTMAAAFQAQPYHWPVIGWMEDLKRISYEDVTQFYHRYYDPSNALVVAVGDFQAEELFRTISKSFGNIASAEKPEHYRYRDPLQRGERRILVSREASLPYIILGYHVPNFSHSDAYVLEVISAILSAGKSSRLYKNIVRSKSLAISAGTDYSLLSIDPPLFQIYAEPLPGVQTEQLEQALLEEIEKLREKAIDDRELQKAKNQLESAFVFGQDSIFFQGMLLARYEIADSWEEIRNYLPAVREVSAEDVSRVAKKYFQSTNQTIGILKPLAASEKDSRKRKGKPKGS